MNSLRRKKYMEKDEFLDMVAIAESTPGPIAINAATYIGYKRLGFLGSLCSNSCSCTAVIYHYFADKCAYTELSQI